MMESIRPLTSDEVELKIKTCYEDNKALFLLYADSRACRKILDETFGIFGWEDEYLEIKGTLYCTIRVRNPDTGEWVKKQDCGTMSYVEKQKGEASDAFKRACYCLGIGRELYTKINIKISVETEYDESRKLYKPKKTPRYNVARMEVNESSRKIQYLVITNANGGKVFEWGFPPDDAEKYVSDSAERARGAVWSLCQQYASINGCTVTKAYRAAMKGLEYNEEGYAKGILRIKQQLNGAGVHVT